MQRISAVLVATTIAICLPLISALDASAVSRRDWDECKAKDADKSIAACTRILESRGINQKDRAAAFFNRGVSHADNRDDKLAIADFGELIKLDPRYPRSYNGRGTALSRRGEYQSALRDFDRAIELDRNFAMAYNNRGEAYEGLEDLRRALEDYEKAISMQPKLARPYINRADIRLYAGDLERAVADYTKGIGIYSGNAMNFQHRAIAHTYLGENAKALADVTQATELEPKFARHALWLEIIGRRNQLTSRLPDLVDKINMAQWPAPLVRLFLGQTTLAAVVAAAENDDAAIKKGRLCDVSFFGGMASAQRRDGDKNEAIRLLTAAAKSCPLNSVTRGAAEAELKLLGGAL